MSIIIRLQNLAWNANAADIRQFFSNMVIPDGGVHIVGGDQGDAFIAFGSDEDARQAMLLDGQKLKDVKIKLLLSSRSEMQKVIEMARQQALTLQNLMQSLAATGAYNAGTLQAALSSLPALAASSSLANVFNSGTTPVPQAFMPNSNPAAASSLANVFSSSMSSAASTNLLSNAIPAAPNITNSLLNNVLTTNSTAANSSTSSVVPNTLTMAINNQTSNISAPPAPVLKQASNIYTKSATNSLVSVNAKPASSIQNNDGPPSANATNDNRNRHRRTDEWSKDKELGSNIKSKSRSRSRSNKSRSRSRSHGKRSHRDSRRYNRSRSRDRKWRRDRSRSRDWNKSDSRDKYKKRSRSRDRKTKDQDRSYRDHRSRDKRKDSDKNVDKSRNDKREEIVGKKEPDSRFKPIPEAESANKTKIIEETIAVEAQPDYNSIDSKASFRMSFHPKPISSSNIPPKKNNSSDGNDEITTKENENNDRENAIPELPCPPIPKWISDSSLDQSTEIVEKQTNQDVKGVKPNTTVEQPTSSASAIPQMPPYGMYPSFPYGQNYPNNLYPYPGYPSIPGGFPMPPTAPFFNPFMTPQQMQQIQQPAANPFLTPNMNRPHMEAKVQQSKSDYVNNNTSSTSPRNESLNGKYQSTYTSKPQHSNNEKYQYNTNNRNDDDNLRNKVEFKGYQTNRNPSYLGSTCVELTKIPLEITSLDVKRFFSPIPLYDTSIKLIPDENKTTQTICVKFMNVNHKLQGLKCSGKFLRGFRTRIFESDEAKFDSTVATKVVDSEAKAKENLGNFLKISFIPKRCSKQHIWEAFTDDTPVEITMTKMTGKDSLVATVKFENSKPVTKALANKHQFVIDRSRVKIEPSNEKEHIAMQAEENLRIVEAKDGNKRGIFKSSRGMTEKVKQDKIQNNDSEDDFKDDADMPPSILADDLEGNPHCLWLKNLPLDVSEKDLVMFFENVHISPLHIQFVKDDKGKLTGEAYCEFSPKSLMLGMMKHNCVLRGNTISVELGKDSKQKLDNKSENSSSKKKEDEQQPFKSIEPQKSLAVSDTSHSSSSNQQHPLPEECNSSTEKKEDEQSVKSVEQQKPPLDTQSSEISQASFNKSEKKVIVQPVKSMEPQVRPLLSNANSYQIPFRKRHPIPEEYGAPAYKTRLMDPRFRPRMPRMPLRPPTAATEKSSLPDRFAVPGCVVALSNVPYRATVNDILELFYEYNLQGEDVVRRYNENGNPTGDARVCLEAPYLAHRAAELLDGSIIMGREVRVTVLE